MAGCQNSMVNRKQPSNVLQCTVLYVLTCTCVQQTSSQLPPHNAALHSCGSLHPPTPGNDSSLVV